MLLSSARYSAHSSPRRESRTLTAPRRSPTEPAADRPASVTVRSRNSCLGPLLSGCFCPALALRGHVWVEEEMLRTDCCPWEEILLPALDFPTEWLFSRVRAHPGGGGPASQETTTVPCPRRSSKQGLPQVLGMYYFSDKKHPASYLLELQLFLLTRLSKGKDLKETAAHWAC